MMSVNEAYELSQELLAIQQGSVEDAVVLANDLPDINDRLLVIHYLRTHKHGSQMHSHRSDDGSHPHPDWSRMGMAERESV